MAFPSIQGYLIQGVLGEGGMGTVYLARQLSLNRPVAIKILPTVLADNAAYVARFRQEAKAAAGIRHPNLVQIFDAGEDAGQCYFVMEYVSGETAGQRVARKGRLDEESALLISESCAVALEYAWHQARLVHRDVKPDNLLIDGDGTVKVADLGLAKIIGPAANTITMTKMMIGTPYYCAPEQAQGESNIDCRADIYALGATLYHLVTGYAPFSDTSGITAMVRNVTDYVLDPIERNPAVSEPFAWLVEKMMAKKPEHRQSSWAEALEDIDRALNGRLPASEPLPPRASTVMRSPKRKLHPVAQAAPMEISNLCSHMRYGGGGAAPAGMSAQSESASAGTSWLFRIFLACAAVLTLALYVTWFVMTYVRHGQ